MQHVKPTESISVAISSDERAFFVELGVRIAELRKAQNITQVQVAEELGITQQTFNSYEVGRRRIPVSALPMLARLLGVTMDELLGEPKTKNRPGPAPKLQQQIERVSRLPRAKQKFVSEMLEALIKQQAASN